MALEKRGLTLVKKEEKMARYSNPFTTDREARIEEQSVREKLLMLKHQHGGLYIPTPWGIVDAGSISALYGEGPNVQGFRMTYGSWAAKLCASQEEIEAADSPRPADGMSLWEHAHAWAHEQAHND